MKSDCNTNGVGSSPKLSARRRALRGRAAVAAATRSRAVARGAMVVVAVGAAALSAHHASANTPELFFNASIPTNYTGFYDLAGNYQPNGTPTSTVDVYVDNSDVDQAGGDGTTGFAAGNLFVGNGSVGTFQQSTGTFLDAGALTLGNTSTGTGFVFLSGGTFNAATGLNVGLNSNVVSGAINTMNVSGTATLNVVAGGLNVGAGVGSAGVLDVLAGTVTANTLFAGKAAGATGYIFQTGGSVTDSGTTDSFVLGGSGAAGTASVGIYTLGGGTGTPAFTTTSALDVGGYGSGQLNVLGGAMNDTGGSIQLARYAGGYGVIDVSGGTLNQSNSGKYIDVGENGLGILNVRGSGTVLSASTNAKGGLVIGNGSGGSGVVNLLTGGVLNVPSVTTQTGGVGVLNLNGGTLGTVNVASTVPFVSGVTNAYVYPGGATFNTSAVSGTVAQTLQAPGGSGITGISVTGGAGYMGAAPIVKITDPTGFGATGIASLNSSGGITVTVLNPGTGYSANPTVTLIGGSVGSGATATATVNTGAAPAAGYLTKVGGNTLTLSPPGTNGFAGMIVNGGTLAAGTVGAFGSGGSASLSVAGGATASFNGQYPVSAGTQTGALTLGGLTSVTGSNFAFNLSGGSADGVNVANAASVTGGTISVNNVGAPTAGSYYLFDDGNGGLQNFTLNSSQGTISSGGLTYTLTLTPTSTYDLLTVSAGMIGKLYFTGAGGQSLNGGGNYSASPTGSPAATAPPMATADVYFTATPQAGTSFGGVTQDGLTALNSLEFNTSGSISIAPGTATGPLTITSGANTFAAGTAIVLDPGTGPVAISAGLSLPLPTEAFNVNGGSLALSGPITGTASTTNLVLTGSAGGSQTSPAFVLSGSNSYTGSTNLSAGVAVRLGSSTALGNNTNALVLSGNASSASLLDVYGQSVGQGTLNLAGGVLVGSLGTGVLTLNASGGAGVAIDVTAPANTYTDSGTAPTTVSVPSLVLPNGGYYIKPSTTAAIYVTITSAVNIASGTLTIDEYQEPGTQNGQAAADLAIGGTISGAGGITVANFGTVPGAGTPGASVLAVVELSGTNTYTGPTNISFGKVVITNSSALGSASSPVNIIGGLSTAGPGTGTNGGTLQLGDAQFVAANNSTGFVASNVTGLNVLNAINLGGAISGSYGAGLINDTGSNTLSGPITLTQGQVNVSVTNNTTLALNGSIGQTSGMSAGLTKMTAGLLASGATGAGTLVLNAANTYAGGTNVSVGTLVTGPAGTLGTGNVSVLPSNASLGATLTLSNSMSIADSATLTVNTSGGSVVNLNDPGNGTEVIAALVNAVDGFSALPGTYTVAQLDAMDNGAFASTFGTTDGSSEELAISATASPEPTSLLLAVAAGAPLVLGRRRRRIAAGR